MRIAKVEYKPFTIGHDKGHELIIGTTGLRLDEKFESLYFPKQLGYKSFDEVRVVGRSYDKPDVYKTIAIASNNINWIAENELDAGIKDVHQKGNCEPIRQAA